MARALDPVIADTLKKYGYGKDAVWDCHGVWVVYHKILEQIAVKAGIKFDRPSLLENNGTAKSVAICVFGKLADREEWSIGEAAPGNNKNSYPYAMAEKRGKDRVILKLIGLHGLAYSEDEADDFKEGGHSLPKPDDVAPQTTAPDPKHAAAVAWAEDSIPVVRAFKDAKAFDKWYAENRAKVPRIEGYDRDLFNRLSHEVGKKLDAFNPIGA